MPGTFKMEESFVIATILKTKNKYFHEKYVTYEELNYIQNELIQTYKENNIDIWITDEINDYYYIVDEVILPNKENNIKIQDLETNYIGLCPSLEIMKILWNEKFILSKLLELKEKQLRKILNNQKKLTKKKEKNN